MKLSARKVIMVILALVFVATGAQLLWLELDSREGRAEYDEAAQLAGLLTAPPTEPTEPAGPVQQPDPTAPADEPDPPVEPVGTEAPTQAPSDPEATQPSSQGPPATEPTTQPKPTQPPLTYLDLSRLQAVNPDVVGWITIPDTILSYPLLRGEDNDYYLKRTWKHTYSSLGSIYLDYRCDPLMGDHHTVIYGHRMRYDDMFGSLRNYKRKSYWKAHPEVHIINGDTRLRYKIFAAYQIDSVDGHVYQLVLKEEERQAYIDACLAASVIDTGVVPRTDQPIITLSTCTAQGTASRDRWVVQAVLMDEN